MLYNIYRVSKVFGGMLVWWDGLVGCNSAPLIWWASLVGWFGGMSFPRACVFCKVKETRLWQLCLFLSLFVSSVIIVIDLKNKTRRKLYE